jgi:hypothetical protein
MKVYARKSDFGFYMPAVGAVVIRNHEIDLPDDAAITLVQEQGNNRREDGSLDFTTNRFSFTPFPEAVRETTEYAPSDVSASDYTDDKDAPPFVDPAEPATPTAPETAGEK